MRVPFLLTCILTVAPSIGFAWGPEGHQIVGRIAEQRLSAEAKMGVAPLIAEGEALGGFFIPLWADFIKDDRPETRPWHYVDIPIQATNYQAQVHCPDGQCVITQLEHFSLLVGDTNATLITRTEALRFLVHFAGDIHQPLHCAERNDDMGGNKCYVKYPGQEKSVNLHAVWDDHLLVDLIGQEEVAAFADRLHQEIREDDASHWASGTPEDWAWATHLLAIQHTYKGIPPYGKATSLPTAYIEENQPVVREQLQKAGVRLAMLLNRAFSPVPPPANGN